MSCILVIVTELDEIKMKSPTARFPLEWPSLEEWAQAKENAINAPITTVCETIAADYDANYTTCLSGSPTSMDFLLIRMCVQCPRALH